MSSSMRSRFPASLAIAPSESLESHTSFLFFFFNATATTEIYTLSLHDALPIWRCARECGGRDRRRCRRERRCHGCRSEEHTSELQSRGHLVCRLLLEKKNFQHAPSHNARYDRARSANRCGPSFNRPELGSSGPA